MPTADRDDAGDDLQDLFDNAPCGYVSALPDGRIIKVNRTLATWLGINPSDLTNRRFPDLLNIAGKIYFETHFAPLLRMQGYFHEVALEIVAPDGRRLPVLVNAAERRDEAGAVKFVRITIFNAADRRRYEQELLEARRAAEQASHELHELNRQLENRIAEAVCRHKEAEEALRQTRKLEAIGQLTGGVAHDFNNLLTVILGGLEVIDRQVAALPPDATVERIQRASKMATHGARRAATLTSRLLAFSRRMPLEPKAVDPNRLIVGLADLLHRTLGESVTLETVSGAGLWRTLVDPGELENAVLNLAVNARDAMPRGGRLTIETSNAFLDETYVQAIPEPVSSGQYALIAVTDTGTGMGAETVTRVFEPFFTTKDVGQGTGLGLSQVYGFVRQSQGHVRVYSELGVGTTVKIYLPRLLADDVVTHDPEDKVTLSEIHGGQETILLVEDHDDLRAYSASVLRDLGYRTLVAANGAAALDALQSVGHVDLLFTDVVLPAGIDGRHLADEAVRRRPQLKVLFTTGYTQNAIVHNGRLDPGVKLITKPFSAAELGLKIRTILDEQ